MNNYLAALCAAIIPVIAAVSAFAYLFLWGLVCTSLTSLLASMVLLLS